MTTRARDWAPAAVWMCVIFAASSVPITGVPGPPAYLAHFVEYAVLAALIVFAVRGSDRAAALLLAVALAAAYGATDEIHQMFVPTRTPDFLDWLADGAGAFAGAGIYVLAVSRIRSRA